MSSEQDFGSDAAEPDEPHDHPDKDQEVPDMTPEPEPQPENPPAIDAAPADRVNFDTPSVGQLYAMFPDAIPHNRPEVRKRHLAAVPDLSETDSLPSDVEDEDDPLIAAALRWRVAITFWWRPALSTVAVFIVAVCAFTTAGPVVGVAWCLYGTGWVAHAVWNAYGRPSTPQLYRALADRHRAHRNR